MRAYWQRVKWIDEIENLKSVEMMVELSVCRRFEIGSSVKAKIGGSLSHPRCNSTPFIDSVVVGELAAAMIDIVQNGSKSRFH